MSALFAFLHHVAAFFLVSALVVESSLLSGPLTAWSAKRLLRVDMLFGISAGALLVIGLLRVFFFEKGTQYYLGNPYFHGKLSLFVFVGLLSIVPTLEFLSWRKAVRAGQVPAVDGKKLRTIRMIVYAEQAGVVLILLFAVLMVRGG